MVKRILKTRLLGFGIKSEKNPSRPPQSSFELRDRGDAARDTRNWPSAAYFYDQVLKREPTDAALWLQQGHMMKECGLFAKARDCYEQAATLLPSDPEPLVQLAILSKIQGDFANAAALYKRCLTFGYANSEFIRSELDFLRRSGPTSSQALEDDEVIFYLSSIFMPVPENDSSKLKKYLGAANYSYGYIMRGYQAALEGAGYKCRVISNPEYQPDIRARSGGKAVHIGFYPPDGPRFLKGAYNITCIAWEFERLRSRAEAKSYHAFSDAVSMLSRAQEVWAISEFGAEAVRRSGIELARAVPTPVTAGRNTGRPSRPKALNLQKTALRLDRIGWVPLAVSPAMQSTLSSVAESRKTSLFSWLIEADEEKPPVIFLCVFNVHDYRKQIKPLIEAFVRFSRENSNAYLLLKISCIDSDKLDINTVLFMEQIADPGEMTPPLVSDRILMTTDALSRDEMNTLNEVASYYVCTSHAEGQNLPLIETMGWGVVPLSVDHTAMRDYISEQNAIVIPSQLHALTPRLTTRYGMYGISTHYVEARSVYNALTEAMAQSDSQYAAMSNAAVATVVNSFGPTSFLMALQHSLDLAGVKLRMVLAA